MTQGPPARKNPILEAASQQRRNPILEAAGEVIPEPLTTGSVSPPEQVATTVEDPVEIFKAIPTTGPKPPKPAAQKPPEIDILAEALKPKVATAATTSTALVAPELPKNARSRVAGGMAQQAVEDKAYRDEFIKDANTICGKLW
jgi:hypothetical protein